MFERASRLPGRTGEHLLFLLERRLDNVVYRLGFAQTRPMARQLVVHRHILVNGAEVNIPSYEVRPGDVITLKPEMAKNIEEQGVAIPPWLARENNVGRVIGMPRREYLDPEIKENQIVEFYAR